MTPDERDPEVSAFVSAAASSPRMFWLDGGGARRQSGGSAVSTLGVLAEDDVSLTFDAARRQVVRHQHGAGEVVGDDVFTRPGSASSTATAATPTSAGSATSATPAGPTSRAGRPSPGAACRTRSGCASAPPHHLPPPSRTSYGAVAGATVSYDVREEDVPEGEVGVPEEYAAAFARVQAELHAGNSYEVNLTYRDATLSAVDPVTAYLRLRAANPAPYSGYLQHHGVHLLSSSPERYATVDRHRVLEARPIKGTTPRGRTPEEDDALAEHLRTDPKMRAENLMITDLMRNDLAQVCEVGSVEVPSLMAVESYAAVHQLVTTVRGRLREDVATVTALRALFPAGSMTGAPKRRTMAIIDEVEATPRGVYAGAFGWISGDGRADLSVVIRSLVATRVRTRAGGGGVALRAGHRRRRDRALGPGRGVGRDPVEGGAGAGLPRPLTRRHDDVREWTSPRRCRGWP